MQAVNYSHARNNLKSLIDEACDNNEEIIITTKNDKSVVMISLDEYNKTHMQIKQDVEEALLQAERGELLDADDVFDRVLAKYED
ncbi:MAG TPA: type II toxin-antitoxin system Phd/YefM family antitoxin [Epsilonproteobacteria bacterium]|nr:type II toxin-antitoxin system Phd/YefM family antitoxin [Campylobacterota bacterium]